MNNFLYKNKIRFFKKYIVSFLKVHYEKTIMITYLIILILFICIHLINFEVVKNPLLNKSLNSKNEIINSRDIGKLLKRIYYKREKEYYRVIKSNRYFRIFKIRRKGRCIY